jgi:hypothetical protein
VAHMGFEVMEVFITNHHFRGSPTEMARMPGRLERRFLDLGCSPNPPHSDTCFLGLLACPICTDSLTVIPSSFPVHYSLREVPAA